MQKKIKPKLAFSPAILTGSSLYWLSDEPSLLKSVDASR